LEALTAFLLQNIEKEQNLEVKATFCKGTSKLVLSGMLTDINVGSGFHLVEITAN
jgi:hypothetical protein